ncbi:NLR family CARD domain-containing protein 3-like [Salarias fasciatus]|uniref:NLR family CARD domain-containing protein 3-like n=1 Tax=Salarias fasciatus TaxID=181472 RepID=UPI0011767C7F|nr:NLR family CARD domain-containing protein 3-like [Salarias fasciatus]
MDQREDRDKSTAQSLGASLISRPLFQLLQEHFFTFVSNELKNMKNALDLDSSEYFRSLSEGDDEERMRGKREPFLKLTLHFLRELNEDGLADRLQSHTEAVICQRKLKARLKENCQNVFEGIAKTGSQTALSEIYTEQDITEAEDEDPNRWHEFDHIEAVFRKTVRPQKKIQQCDLFKPDGHKAIRTVLTRGVAGIGKTILTQKFTLDWAEDKLNEDIHFTFPFNFRELNVLKEKRFSLVELLLHFFPVTTEGICRLEDFRVLFILNGLDECRLPLDFHGNEVQTDPQVSTSLDGLLTNLIWGKLLPSALIWITTRPAAANHIPAGCVHRVTEVQGFSDPQKEEYFRKRFKEPKQASRIISHIQMSRTFHILCHIPAFCWITAAVLEKVLRSGDEGELPRTLTEMFIHILVMQTELKKVKYDGGAETDSPWTTQTTAMITSLGKLAFDQLQKGNLIFYESDLKECGIDIRAASVYSGLFTQIFKEQKGVGHIQVFTFLHLSFQEFLAALYAHVTFTNHGVNILKGQTSSPTKTCETKRDVTAQIQFYQDTVDEVLKAPHGRLDLFLRFLLGLSMKSNQIHLQGLLPQTASPLARQETVQHIKSKMTADLPAERSTFLFHCLNELNDRSLEDQVQGYLSAGRLATDTLSHAQWSALVFILLSSEENLERFDLKQYGASEEAFRSLLPIVRTCNEALLSGCNLSQESCGLLSNIISSQSCSLKELDLSNNDLRDSGVQLLSEGLKGPLCELEALRLSGCLITEKGCRDLASALTSTQTRLKELDLSYNDLGEAGPELHRAVQDLKRDQRSSVTLWVEPGGARWMTPGLKKYWCDLELDCNTVHRWIKLSEDRRTAWHVGEDQRYPHHSDRFDCHPQLLCRNQLTARSYWEVDWKGKLHVSVSYGGIPRKGSTSQGVLGKTSQSWSLKCSEQGGFSFCHNQKTTPISSTSSTPSASNRVAVYVDRPAGTLSFYRVSSGRPIHLYTVSTEFTEPLYAGFRFGLESGSESSMSLCSLQLE